ncbi:MAG TPA: peptide chain release factor N(5)-glutamine methyltransferase [Ignavibacteria bacterium]|jgi:release factor glutamine methyltransferase
MEAVQKPWKILELLKTTEELFKKYSIENPRLNAELLLAGTLNTERIKLYLDFEKPLTDNELAEFRNKVKRRLNYEPVQYILGEAYFFGRKFKVNPSVLIPRPETELLVEKTIEKAKGNNLSNPAILEIGAGSGCISISVAGSIDCHIDAIELNDDAILTAQENSELNGVSDKICFKRSDFLNENINIDNYDIVISNPPYIAKDDVNQLPDEIKNFEPHLSLTDCSDGLEFYRRIFELYNSAIKKPFILLEIGDGKKTAVERLINNYTIKNYTIHKDLLNIYRVLEFKNDSVNTKST